jgi:hypothetical protein
MPIVTTVNLFYPPGSSPDVTGHATDPITIPPPPAESTNNNCALNSFDTTASATVACPVRVPPITAPILEE